MKKTNTYFSKIFSFLLIITLYNQANAQFLPKGLTSEEKLMMKDYYFNNQNNTFNGSS